MSHDWSNEKRLVSLNASAKGDVLTFESPGETAEVRLVDGDIAEVTCRAGGKVTTLGKEGVKHLVVGEGNAQRDVYHFLKPGGAAPTLRLGITKHRGRGTWSSLPHDFELRPETGFEEAFFYILEGATQRAYQVGRGVWFDGSPVDAVWMVRDRTFCTIPMGYHPVVGEPGVHVSYVWVYLAKHKHWEKV